MAVAQRRALAWLGGKNLGRDEYSRRRLSGVPRNGNRGCVDDSCG
jgi:hypothetical protein